MPKHSNPQAADVQTDDLASRAADGMLGPNPFIGLNGRDIVAAAGKVTASAMRQPLKVLEHEAGVVRDLVRVLAGRSELAPAAGDKRFADLTWQSNPFLRRYLQGYLAWSKGIASLVDDLGLDSRNAQRARFVTSLLTEAMSPSNALASNPGAVRKAIETGGLSLAAGMKNMFADLRDNGGMPSQVDKKAFAVGRNLALSEGSVVFRNEMLELIQFRPTTATVHSCPMLMVPPQINKYYVYDLAPGKSMVAYLLDRGFQVFIVSWRNPKREHSHWGFSEYVAALLEVIAAVKEITSSKDLSLHAACSGAMTTAALLGHLAVKKDKSVRFATQMVAVMDQDNDESQLGMFATPQIIARAKASSARKGVLEGRDMGRVFAWLRPNDLVWNYWVNNYLMGNPPPAFDILYWNNDTTRLPAKFHAELLDVFANRSFAEPGALEILGTPIDLASITIDRYVVAGLTDHITPWRNCFRTARLPGGKRTMVVSSSGHIQSLINPPGNPKSKYFLNDQPGDDPDEWLQGATAVNDTWWGHWGDWVAKRSGARKKAPAELGSALNKPIIAAPGEYVFE